ncbi:glycosyltransferase involved in cell wall biosynthesis [Nesterenkonia sandarakina]|uniref:Glycosyltransferase involved in cell wall biosynthesis n=2 Tax=Nesterenkonia sandarakina TaxID=272918 RepID=A0A2T0YSY5_9MICC|nr:glycosyltransferase involved in cell wall biosynthesis [Nesterenkonia sandarakina]
MSRTLVSFPHAGLNPYSNMLYLHPRAAGWKVIESSQLQRLLGHLRRLTAGDVFHVQWSWPLFRSTGTTADAAAAVDAFCGAVESCRERGVQLLWTVHNMASHDSQFMELESRFNNFMGRSADVIIQLNDYTEQVCREDFSIGDAQFVTIPHSSYQGVYSDEVSASEARSALGVEPNDAVIGFLGQVRPYKGVERLIEVAADLQKAGRSITVLIAGRPQGGVDKKILELVAEHDVRCVSSFEFIDDEDLQLWFRASDVMVFPYRKVLNSGSAYLAASFGTPCVLPREPQFEELFHDEEWVGLFDPDDEDDLRSVLQGMLDSPGPLGASAAQFSRTHLPWTMSAQFLEILRGHPSKAETR